MPGTTRASATRIQLSGSTAAVEGEGATVEGSTVVITQEGTYVVSGQLEGQIVVETADDVKVQLVLAGASVHNESGPAIYVKETGQVLRHFGRRHRERAFRRCRLRA